MKEKKCSENKHDSDVEVNEKSTLNDFILEKSLK